MIFSFYPLYYDEKSAKVKKMNEFDIYEKIKKLEGAIEKDDNWGGFYFHVDREKAKILPEFLMNINDGMSFVLVDKYPSSENVQKLKKFFELRTEKVLKRIRTMGKKGVKSLLTKGSRWAVDTAFGNEEDMKVTEFSGVFAFADPTVIDYDDFEVALKTMENISNVKIEFWKSDKHLISTIRAGSENFSKSVALKIKESNYLSDEGRKYYGTVGCLSNFAWARRQMISGIMEMAAKDAFGKSVQVKKIADISLTILFDNGKELEYRFNFPKTHDMYLSKEGNELILFRNASYRMVPTNE